MKTNHQRFPVAGCENHQECREYFVVQLSASIFAEPGDRVRAYVRPVVTKGWNENEIAWLKRYENQLVTGELNSSVFLRPDGAPGMMCLNQNEFDVVEILAKKQR